jgi:hypothetical protein
MTKKSNDRIATLLMDPVLRQSTQQALCIVFVQLNLDAQSSDLFSTIDGHDLVVNISFNFQEENLWVVSNSGEGLNLVRLHCADGASEGKITGELLPFPGI